MALTDHLTIAEAEAATGLKARALRRRCEAGEIPGAEKKGVEWLIPREALPGIRGRYVRRRPAAGGVAAAREGGEEA